MQLRLVLLTDEHGSVGMTGTGMSSDAMWFQTDASEVGFLNTSFLLESFRKEDGCLILYKYDVPDR